MQCLNAVRKAVLAVLCATMGACSETSHCKCAYGDNYVAEVDDKCPVGAFKVEEAKPVTANGCPVEL
jgi:hypothetical protein